MTSKSVKKTKNGPTPIGAFLHAKRDALHMTRTELSEKADVPVSTIASIETGRSKSPDLLVLKSLVQSLDLSWVDVLNIYEIQIAPPKFHPPVTGALLETKDSYFVEWWDDPNTFLGYRLIAQKGDDNGAMYKQEELRFYNVKNDNLAPTYISGDSVTVKLEPDKTKLATGTIVACNKGGELILGRLDDDKILTSAGEVYMTDCELIGFVIDRTTKVNVRLGYKKTV